MPFDLPDKIRAELEAQKKELVHTGESVKKRVFRMTSEKLLPDRSVMEAKEKADELEKTGWENWLLTLFPFAFEEDFSDDHRKFWGLRWSVLLRIREQKKYVGLGLPIPDKFVIKDKEMVCLVILGRGLAKSGTLEPSAIMRGALLSQAYCLYLCESNDQAEEHLGNLKILIENEESRLTEFYPNMAIDPNAVVSGKKAKDRTDLFITIGGFIARAKGLNSKLRGLRIGNLRPDDIKLDDIDSVNDSIAVSVKKLKQITSSVIPTQARRWAIIDFGQNLIAENGVMTQIHTGKSDAFAERTTIGVTNTFKEFREGIEYKTYFDETDGRVRHKILETAVPTWDGVRIPQAQKFLNDSGLETFIAEYMNSFAHQKTEKVFHEFNEARHIITWSAFEKVFGVRYIPPHWRAKASADIGYSKESLSAWLFVASAAQNSPLPSRYFAYRTMTFEQESIDDQAEKIWEKLFPDYEAGRRHFEAEQKFTNYPELFRLLDKNPKCSPSLKNYAYNAASDSYELKKVQAAVFGSRIDDNATAEDKALFHVHQAQKTFRSQIQIWSISHEKTGEQKTLAQKYGIPVQKTKEFKADSGVAEANHLLRGDYTVPHPFYDDEMLMNAKGEPTGLYKLGSPYIFFIVDDDQLKAPRDDGGHKTFREQVSAQRWTQEKLTELGLTRTIPMKFQSDHCDAFKMFAVSYTMPATTPLTQTEEFIEKVKAISPGAIIIPGEIITPERQMQIQEVQEMARKEMRQKYGDGDDENFDNEDYEGEDEIIW